MRTRRQQLQQAEEDADHVRSAVLYTPHAVMLLWPWLTLGCRRALRCVSVAMRDAVVGHVDSVTGDLDPPDASVFVAEEELEGEDKTDGFQCILQCIDGPPRQGRLVPRPGQPPDLRDLSRWAANLRATRLK
jgi:hypothetical protein